MLCTHLSFRPDSGATDIQWPHLAIVLLKKYFRDLPDPNFPETLCLIIRQCPLPSGDPTDMAAILYIRDTLLPQLKPCVYILSDILKWVTIAPCMACWQGHLDLLHDVSLHSATNRMDAHNLAVVICPNFVKGFSPVKDVIMCSVPGGGRPTSDGNTQASVPQTLLVSVSSTVSDGFVAEEKTTLGAVIVLCIQRYEVFDEVQDRSEPVQSPFREPIRSTSPQPCSLTAPAFVSKRPLSLNVDDEDSLDDAILVVPIGPIGSTNCLSRAPRFLINPMNAKILRQRAPLTVIQTAHLAPATAQHGVDYAPSSVSNDRKMMLGVVRLQYRPKEVLVTSLQGLE